jgi:hypothetical protein
VEEKGRGRASKRQACCLSGATTFLQITCKWRQHPPRRQHEERAPGTGREARSYGIVLRVQVLGLDETRPYNWCSIIRSFAIAARWPLHSPNDGIRYAWKGVGI